MFYPEVPVLHVMLVISVVVVINKVLDWLICRLKPVEKVIDGITAEIVRAGVILAQGLCRYNIGKKQLFTSLREQGHINLGEVRRAYIETSGGFGVFRARRPRPGLRIEPAWDVGSSIMSEPNTDIAETASMSCCDCGTFVHGPGITPPACAAYTGTAWTPATLNDDPDL